MSNATKLTGFESDILESWGDWQQDDTSCFSFYNAKLRVWLSPEFPAGAAVEFITFDLGQNVLSIWAGNDEVFRCKLQVLPVLDD